MSEKKYKIIFFAGDGLPFQATSLDERPLAGGETDVIKLAEKLSLRGHDVTVYTTYKNPVDSIPKYYHVSQFEETIKPCDIFVVVKDLQALLLNVQCRVKLFLTDKGFNDFSTFGLGDKRYANRIHALIGKSKWHTNTLCDSSGFPLPRAVAIGSGVELSNFSGTERRERKRLIFTASPYKGLELTIPILKYLREKDPQIEFHSFSGLEIYSRENPIQGISKEQYENMNKELEKIPNVFIHGNILQKELAREYMKSAVFFYPNIWLESSAKIVLEAQAGGCPIVSSALGALPEIVGDAGILINEKVGSQAYMDKFITATLNLISNDELWSKLSLNGKMRAQKYFSYDLMVERFEKVLEKFNL